MLYQGASVTQMEVLLGIDGRRINAGITRAGIKPCGERYGLPIYKVSEVAPHVIKPAFDVETYIKRMDPRDLPKVLSKEFWAAMKSRQDYEERAGNLWSTQKVISEVGELFKLIKMSLLLMLDGVERTTELTDRQRQLIKSLTHGTLEELAKKIETQFVMPDPTDLDRVRQEVRQEAEQYERQETADDEEL